ncbi:hypothetical protein PWT90_03773 [Aphanocladium album]|nr:hypothetical protein PWT90_03773 [Aphanocladium album]
MADTEQGDVVLEPQARTVTYCGALQSALCPQKYVPLFPDHTANRPVDDLVILTMRRAVLRVWRHREEVPRLAAEQPKGNVRQDMVSRTEALEAATASLSVEAQKRAAKDAQKKTAKAEAAEAKQADKLAKSVVTIKRIERNKRKFVTAVIGLETFGLDLKKCAKDFGKKFATGSSVTKVPSGGEEIVVQGDVSDELEEFILEKYKEIPEDNIELVDDKKKKKAAAS